MVPHPLPIAIGTLSIVRSLSLILHLLLHMEKERYFDANPDFTSSTSTKNY